MQHITGTIVDGKVVLQGAELAEGTQVAVMALENRETAQLSPELLAELNEAIDEADADPEAGISAEELFEQLKKYHRP